MKRVRLLTAGESHGPSLIGVLDGIPAGLRVQTKLVNRDLRRRQHGYGSGRRMLIEQDRVRWTAGIRYGRTLGSTIGFEILNKDWQNWTTRMSHEPVPSNRRPKPITLARPGHADLTGAIKYDTGDIRNVLERASARSTTPRVLAGAICRQLLASVGVRIWSFVDQLGPVQVFGGVEEPVRQVPRAWPDADLADPSPLRCPDPEAERAMIAAVDAAIQAGDSIGGSFIVVAEGVPVGLGSMSEWDDRLDAAIAGAMMSIQAVKGVEIGLGFGVVPRRGREVHDEVDPDATDWRRRTNRSGGLEGGMSTGDPIVVRVAVKPVSTLRVPLQSIDLKTGRPGRAHFERTDVAIMPRAGIVGEGMLALVLADALLTSFGGDTVGDLVAAVGRRRRRSRRPRVEALPVLETDADPELAAGRDA